MGACHLSSARSRSRSGPSWGTSSAASARLRALRLLGRGIDGADGRVLAQVTATIVKPRDDKPYEGFLLITSEISPMASSVYEAGR